MDYVRVASVSDVGMGMILPVEALGVKLLLTQVGGKHFRRLVRGTRDSRMAFPKLEQRGHREANFRVIVNKGDETARQVEPIFPIGARVR